MVFPAQAGVILCQPTVELQPSCLSRASGGDPGKEVYVDVKGMSFPRKRG